MAKTMLYKHPGKHKIHGSLFDYLIVSDDDVDVKIEEGWFLTTPEALKYGQPKPEPETKKVDSIPNSAPSRDEVKTKADELGIEYPSNIPTLKLRKMVEDKIDENS